MLFLLLRKEQMVSIEVKLDHRIHNRIIGQKGKNVRKIMDEYNVDIRFPRNSNEDYVTITGSENAVDDCEEHLLMLEEEYVSSQYTISPETRLENKPRLVMVYMPHVIGGMAFIRPNVEYKAKSKLLCCNY